MEGEEGGEEGEGAGAPAGGGRGRRGPGGAALRPRDGAGGVGGVTEVCPPAGAASPAPGLRILPCPSLAEPGPGATLPRNGGRGLPAQPRGRDGANPNPTSAAGRTCSADAAPPPPSARLPSCSCRGSQPAGPPGRAGPAPRLVFTPGFSPAAPCAPACPGLPHAAAPAPAPSPSPGAVGVTGGAGGAGPADARPFAVQGGVSEGAAGPQGPARSRQDVPDALHHPPRLRGHRQRWVSVGLPCPALLLPVPTRAVPPHPQPPGILQPQWHEAGVPATGGGSPRAQPAPGARAARRHGRALSRHRGFAMVPSLGSQCPAQA